MNKNNHIYIHIHDNINSNMREKLCPPWVELIMLNPKCPEVLDMFQETFRLQAFCSYRVEVTMHLLKTLAVGKLAADISNPLAILEERTPEVAALDIHRCITTNGADGSDANSWLHCWSDLLNASSTKESLKAHLDQELKQLEKAREAQTDESTKALVAVEKQNKKTINKLRLLFFYSIYEVKIKKAAVVVALDDHGLNVGETAAGKDLLAGLKTFEDITNENAQMWSMLVEGPEQEEEVEEYIYIYIYTYTQVVL